MRLVAVLNKEGGSLRDLDLDSFGRRLRDILVEAGHELEIKTVAGKEIVDALAKAFGRDDCDVILVGGGDGTVSTAAGKAMKSDKMLAILPAGTMNLFARGLGLPLDLEEAAKIFAMGHARKVDIATANGRPFVHQFSVGMHPRMVRLRENEAFAGRLGKMRASLSAAVKTLLAPPRVRGTLTIDNEKMAIATPSLGISNNLFGAGHLPYADQPDGGVLGIYVAQPQAPGGAFGLAADMLFGRWQDGQAIEASTAKRARLELTRGSGKLECTIDGELLDLESITELEIHPGALAVLTPPAT